MGGPRKRKLFWLIMRHNRVVAAPKGIIMHSNAEIGSLLRTINWYIPLPDKLSAEDRSLDRRVCFFYDIPFIMETSIVMVNGTSSSYMGQGIDNS